MKWTIRPLRSDDIEYVTKTWLLNFRQSPFASGLGDVVYFNNHNNLILNCLNNANCLLAVDEEMPSFILGYIVFREKSDPDGPDVLHWIYTKDKFRNNGIAKSLINEMHKEETVKTVINTHFADKKQRRYLKQALRDYENVFYNPYLFLTSDF